MKCFQPKKSVVTSPHYSASSSSDDEAMHHPPSNMSLIQPPVPRPRKSKPSGPVTSTPVPKKSSSSSSVCSLFEIYSKIVAFYGLIIVTVCYIIGFTLFIYILIHTCLLYF